MLITPVVTLAGKIYPLRMPEFISHKIKVSISCRSNSQQTDHFMQSDPPVYYHIMIKDTHPRINFLVHQAEKDSLIPHHSQVMTLCIADGMFLHPFIGQFIKHIPDIPLLVLFLLNQLNPIIRYPHTHPKIKSDAPFFRRHSQSGHPAHIFRNGYCSRIHLMNHFIGQRQISNGIFILVSVIIKFILRKITAQTVIPVQHTGNPVKAEAVKMKFISPILTIRQQETKHFILAIIKATGIPQLMFSLFTFIKILVIITGQTTKSFQLISHSMRMYKVHNYPDSIRMRFIHQTL